MNIHDRKFEVIQYKILFRNYANGVRNNFSIPIFDNVNCVLTNFFN